MRKTYLYILFLFFITACKSKRPEQPLWINRTGTATVPKQSFSFQSKLKNWKAALLSFTQPVPLQIWYTSDGFLLTMQTKAGITEGPAQIMLTRNGYHFYYDVVLYNDTVGAITARDYRSPKTVNPDSSLEQQRITHRFDQWRNIVKGSGANNYFLEEILNLPATAGTFRAQQDKPISAFYMQPGSAVSIPVKAEYKKEQKLFSVTAGPLYDKHGNTVADGTNVAFLFMDKVNHYRMEAALLNGYATVSIPDVGNSYTLHAKVNETVSSTIQLIAR